GPETVGAPAARTVGAERTPGRRRRTDPGPSAPPMPTTPPTPPTPPTPRDPLATVSDFADPQTSWCPGRAHLDHQRPRGTANLPARVPSPTRPLATLRIRKSPNARDGRPGIVLAPGPSPSQPLATSRIRKSPNARDGPPERARSLERARL